MAAAFSLSQHLYSLLLYGSIYPHGTLISFKHFLIYPALDFNNNNKPHVSDENLTKVRHSYKI